MTKLKQKNGHKEVKLWSKKAILFNTKSTCIFDLQQMIGPVNIGNSHWTSVHDVDFPSIRVLYYVVPTSMHTVRLDGWIHTYIHTIPKVLCMYAYNHTYMIHVMYYAYYNAYLPYMYF